jgi:hypothetical protein
MTGTYHVDLYLDTMIPTSQAFLMLVLLYKLSSSNKV